MSFRPMNLNLTDTEMLTLQRLAKEKHTSKTAIVRRALRLYARVNEQLHENERVMFGGLERRIEFIGLFR